MTEKKILDTKSDTQTQTVAEKAIENADSVKNASMEDTPKTQKTQETANTNVTDEAFIYIGPTTRTGLIENTIIKGTRESVEEYLKEAIDEIPQIKKLIVPVESLARNKAKMQQTGTLLNKYYNDILSLSRKTKSKGE